MEMNKSPSPGKSDPAIPTTNDEQCSSPGQTQARTYECNFCKRGFSNAQALGGHMNIHRKDKAKLKQTSPITQARSQQFLDIPKTSTPPPAATNFFLPTRSAFPERTDAVAANWTWNYSSEKHDTTSIPTSDQGYVGSVLKKLPLLTETTILREDDQDQKHSDNKELSSSSSHGADHDEDVDEVDLELRLGHDPSLDSSSSAAKGTRKFF
ncbi:uncharacterized protein LOC141665681 [Apium graveolens]|uniref:uncharacterized protein LOC141665681 n=1 Tax=Apium graveolens TaxID=4045 RepID=UPI003D7A9127